MRALARRYGAGMGRMDEVGDADGWRCWLCDEPVQRERSVNDDRGPSIDTRITDRKAKARSKSNKSPQPDRIAHRGCNTGKGNVTPVVHWPDTMFVADPAPIIPTVERLVSKGGREIFGRCPTKADAEQAATWIADRLSRLEPTLDITTSIESGGGQYLVVVRR